MQGIIPLSAGCRQLKIFVLPYEAISGEIRWRRVWGMASGEVSRGISDGRGDWLKEEHNLLVQHIRVWCVDGGGRFDRPELIGAIQEDMPWRTVKEVRAHVTEVVKRLFGSDEDVHGAEVPAARLVRGWRGVRRVKSLVSLPKPTGTKRLRGDVREVERSETWRAV